MHMSQMILFFLSLLFAQGCKYKISSYSALAPEQKLNAINLERIKAQETSSPAEFKVAIMSDTHNYYQELDEVVKTINQRGPYSFVIITGDITNLGLLEEYNNSRLYFNHLKYPYLVVTGNHDLLANGEIIFEKMFGPKNIDFTFQGSHFFLINNNNWESREIAPDLFWLENSLQASRSEFKLIFAHVPFNAQERFTPEEISEFERLLLDGEVDYFFNGHNHDPSEAQSGNTILITVGSPSKRSYVELSVSSGGLFHQKVSF